ncbi:MAG: sulfite exporter TauE/SafE family protein [Chthonomonadales bacterium]|nr:sulfite exporter TauE/SafE family protein [Chthonomonadales bacterium]
MLFEAVVLAVSAAGGAIAAVAGFGIGSVLTPVLALQLGTKLAVACISVPHAAATALRLWMLRSHVDRHVLWSFGLTSAAGGLVGALLHAYAASRALAVVFGALLLFAGVMGYTGLARRMRFGRREAWVAGALSGGFGGLVGNQGGIRSAALLGFDVSRDAFVATATAIGLVVDAARMPIYLAAEGGRMAVVWPLVAISTAGALLGTMAGSLLLRRFPEPVFRRIVSAIIVALGLYMVASPWL